MTRMTKRRTGERALEVADEILAYLDALGGSLAGCAEPRTPIAPSREPSSALPGVVAAVRQVAQSGRAARQQNGVFEKGYDKGYNDALDHVLSWSDTITKE